METSPQEAIRICYQLAMEESPREVWRRGDQAAEVFVAFLEAGGAEVLEVAPPTQRLYFCSSDVATDDAIGMMVAALQKAFAFMGADRETWEHTARNILEDMGLLFHD